MKNTIIFLQTLMNLTNIPRTGSILFAGMKTSDTISIAEHSFMVTCIAKLISEKAIQNGVTLDKSNVLDACLTHDWQECILLDIPSGSPSYKSYFKDVDFRSLMSSGEKSARDAIDAYLAEEVAVTLSKELSENEMLVLQLADKIGLLLEILEWKYAGLKYEWFQYIWANTVADIAKKITQEFEFITAMIAELEACWKNGEKPTNPFLTKKQFQTLQK